jgi:hypothetical protein
MTTDSSYNRKGATPTAFPPHSYLKTFFPSDKMTHAQGKYLPAFPCGKYNDN